MELEGVGRWTQVKAVREDSPAQQIGVRVGDKLISFWGRSLSFRSLEAVGSILWGPAGTQGKLSISREVKLPAPVGKARKGWPGMELSMEPLGLTIAKVLPKRAADQIELLEHDRISRMGDQSTRYLPINEARQIFKEHKKVHKNEPLKLMIQRDLMFKRPDGGENNGDEI